MAINVKFDLAGNPEQPTIILATRNGNKLGQLDAKRIEISDKLNDASEVSFVVYKYVDGELTNLWDKIVDFKLVYCQEWNLWFEITIELDEETETIKTVMCTQLGQAELSQLKLYNIEINTEDDIARDDYKISILYEENDPNCILNRLLKDKAPHYSIKYVDPTIKKIQRSFSFDGTSIYDAFQEIAKEIGCLFVFHSNSDKNGKIQRTISVYDLQQNCLDCGYRGEFIDKCPECGGTNIKYGYGEDTTIFVTSDELASENIQFTTDTDSVKNCFKLEAGDDLMTATVRNCNPNGTDYIWYFSDNVKEDMSDELVDKIESYNEQYRYYYNEHESNLDSKLVSEYNKLVDKYSKYKEELEPIDISVKGYSSLMNAYYNTVDLSLYLQSGLMPSVKMSDTNAEKQMKLLTTTSLSPVAVADVDIVSLATANSAILAMAKVVIMSTFKVEIKDGSSSLYESGDKKYWKGKFIVTNYSDEEDFADSGEITVELNDDLITVTKQKIDKLLNKKNTDDLSITGLFEKEYNNFCAELKKYALNPLDSFRNACQACIDILIEQGAGNESKKDLYDNLYTPYYNKLKAIESEMKIRENEINIINGVYDEEADKLITTGIRLNIEKAKNQIQDILNFEKYLGEDLLLEFCAYRREDKYSNDNYISDGLNNTDLFKKALEFIKVAEEEIYKSAELQHSISTGLKNLLAIKKFKPLVKYFNVGNWIRVQVDDKIYKLRLLEYDIDFDDFNSISVTFSDVMEIKNGISDTQSILEQAKSMITSYDYVQKQAKQGNEAKSTINNWIEDGLKTALVQIKSNNNEGYTLDNNGITCYAKDDITGEVLPKQLRLTHNILCFTDDNWKTVRQAIGEHTYNVYDKENNQFVNKIGYGVTSDFVTAGYISGSQIIGGDIYSDNYIPNKSGTHLGLIDGGFEFAGNKIVFDAKNDVLTLRDVTIAWDSDTNAPEITDISGLSDYLDNIAGDIGESENKSKDYADKQDEILKTDLTTAYKKYTDSEISELDTAVANYLGVGGTTLIGSSYIISPYIAGGYLNITNTNNNSRVIIDPNNLTNNNYIFQVHNGAQVSVGIKTNGDAVFNGDIVAKSLTLGSSVTIPSTKVDGIDDYATKDSLNNYVTNTSLTTKLNEYATTGALQSYLKTNDLSVKLGDLNVAYRGDVKTTQTKDNTTGIITTTSTYIGVDGKTYTTTTYTTDDSNYVLLNRTNQWGSGESLVKISKDGLLDANNAIIRGTVYATDGEFTGKVTATSGTVAGWNINGEILSKEIVDPNNSNAVYKISLRPPIETALDSTVIFALYKSTDAGNTWKQPFLISSSGTTRFGNTTINDNVSIYNDDKTLSVTVKPDAIRFYENNSSDTGIYRTSDGNYYMSGVNIVTESLVVSGTKSRLTTTESYNERLLYCYETPSPTFGDIGEGKIDETGKCYIFIDDIFTETIDTECTYQVFLQPYGQGECYVAERTSSYFVVEGTKNLSFAWELKAIQKDYDTIRLEEYEKEEQSNEIDVVLSETYGYLNTLLYNPESENFDYD